MSGGLVIPNTWRGAVDPLVSKLAVQAAINEPATFQPDACKMIASILHSMATKLDGLSVPLEPGK